ncbi:hypothetical protein BvCmsF30A_03066 [Escherichia coli]|nr:hypothetical protein BvCmsF30A_03066 [Escherichia coli]
MGGGQGYYFPSVQLEDIHQIKLDFSEIIS